MPPLVRRLAGPLLTLALLGPAAAGTPDSTPATHRAVRTEESVGGLNIRQGMRRVVA